MGHKWGQSQFLWTPYSPTCCFELIFLYNFYISQCNRDVSRNRNDFPIYVKKLTKQYFFVLISIVAILPTTGATVKSILFFLIILPFANFVQAEEENFTQPLQKIVSEWELLDDTVVMGSVHAEYGVEPITTVAVLLAISESLPAERIIPSADPLPDLLYVTAMITPTKGERQVSVSVVVQKNGVAVIGPQIVDLTLPKIDEFCPIEEGQSI